jgi:O-antigen ligase
VRQRALSLLDLSDVTATQRYYLWSAGSRVALDHPLLGVGPGNLRDVWEGYRHPEDPTPPWERFTHAHNNPIQIAAELGLPALVCWFWIWLAFFAHAYRMRGEIARSDRFGRAVLAGGIVCVAAFLAAGLFEYNFGDREVLQTLSLAMALPFAVFHSRDAADSPEANLL